MRRSAGKAKAKAQFGVQDEGKMILRSSKIRFTGGDGGVETSRASDSPSYFLLGWPVLIGGSRGSGVAEMLDV